MVWSLSKDDDGLDSVLPLADDPSVNQQGGTPSLLQPEVPAARQAPIEVDDDEKTRVHVPGAAPSIVVDPQSQVPQTQEQRGRRGPVEATLILKGRKLDNLRAEVAKRRVAHQRKKQRSLLIWAGAGALALCLGWAVGLAFSPSESGDGDDTASAAEAVRGASDPEPSTIVSPPKSAKSTRADLGTLSLEDLPEEHDQEEASPVQANEKDGDPRADEEESATFTLDDLPSD